MAARLVVCLFRSFRYVHSTVDFPTNSLRKLSSQRGNTPVSKKKKFPSVTYQGLALLAEHQPRVRPAIYTALLDRLAVVSRHMIV